MSELHIVASKRIHLLAIELRAIGADSGRCATSSRRVY
jgi:hypothetical protein